MDNNVEHSGVKGMKWGVRKEERAAEVASQLKSTKIERDKVNAEIDSTRKQYNKQYDLVRKLENVSGKSKELSDAVDKAWALHMKHKSLVKEEERLEKRENRLKLGDLNRGTGKFRTDLGLTAVGVGLKISGHENVGNLAIAAGSATSATDKSVSKGWRKFDAALATGFGSMAAYGAFKDYM